MPHATTTTASIPSIARGGSLAILAATKSAMRTSPAGIAAALQLDDIERGRDDDGSAHVLDRGRQQHDDECERHRERKWLSERAQPGGQAVDDRIHAQVLAAPDRERRAEHAEPQENRRRQLVGPDERAMQDVAGDHAEEKEERLDHHQPHAQPFECPSDAAIDAVDHRSADGHGQGGATVDVHRHAAPLSSWRTRRARG
jgi:hypothetical protein